MKQGNFSRLVWIPPGLAVEDERQQKFLQHLRTDARAQAGADLLEVLFEDLRTVITQRLTKPPEAAKSGAPSGAGCSAGLPDLRSARRRLQRAMRRRAVQFWIRNVVHPTFEGDEAEVRESHEELLRQCDGALILYGKVNELWVRRKLRELQKSAGYGRTRPLKALAISMMAPETVEKQRFRTHEAMVITQPETFTAEPLQPFITQLKS